MKTLQECPYDICDGKGEVYHKPYIQGDVQKGDWFQKCLCTAKEPDCYEN